MNLLGHPDNHHLVSSLVGLQSQRPRHLVGIAFANDALALLHAHKVVPLVERPHLFVGIQELAELALEVSR